MPEVRTIRSLGFTKAGEPAFFTYEEAAPDAGELQLETLYSGFSAGTELTFLKNSNPYLHSRWDSERCVFVGGEAQEQFPIRFLGYMESAQVKQSRASGWEPGDVVGCTFGHKSGHTAAAADESLIKLPTDIDPMLGIYVAQMGPIAANGILHADSELLGPTVTRLGDGINGRPVVVNGAGVVGLLTALFAQRASAAEVVITDRSEFRRDRAARLGLNPMTEEEAWIYAKERWNHGANDRGADIVFQTRADSGSLHAGLRALRPQGTVIDLAFYQGGAERLRLGEEFHHNGLAIRCAQIGRVPRGLAYQWDRLRLANETLGLLHDRGADIREHMITHVVQIDDAPDFLRDLVANRPDFLQIVFDFTEQ